MNWVPPAWAAEAEGDISADELLEQARQNTGLSDFGDLAFLEGLRVYVEALNQEARLNRLGMIVARTEIVRMLANRLRFARDLEQHPERTNLPSLPALSISPTVSWLRLLGGRQTPHGHPSEQTQPR